MLFIAENIKEKYKEIIMIDYDQNKFNLTEEKQEKLPSGQNVVSYTLESKDGQEEIVTVINTDNLENEKLNIKHNINENGESEMIIEGK